MTKGMWNLFSFCYVTLGQDIYYPRQGTGTILHLIIEVVVPEHCNQQVEEQNIGYQQEDHKKNEHQPVSIEESCQDGDPPEIVHLVCHWKNHPSEELFQGWNQLLRDSDCETPGHLETCFIW
ncbi:hypothetical protein E2320_002916 [Naja naja]|nr:hypothetical protein E2320_002916 [Naja naja]